MSRKADTLPLSPSTYFISLMDSSQKGEKQIHTSLSSFTWRWNFQPRTKSRWKWRVGDGTMWVSTSPSLSSLSSPVWQKLASYSVQNRCILTFLKGYNFFAAFHHAEFISSRVPESWWVRDHLLLRILRVMMNNNYHMLRARPPTCHVMGNIFMKAP